MRELGLRADVIRTAQDMSARGLTPVRSGNVSVRSEENETAFLITPTGVPYDDLAPSDIVCLDLDGNAEPDQLVPSSEWHMHAAIYRDRPEAKAIVHTHSLFATTLACTQRGIPPFHYMIAILGGDNIRCAEYATFGTPELALEVVKAIKDRKACLIANHGQIVFGNSAGNALNLAEETETLAKQYWHVLQIGGPQLLDSERMADVHKQFEGYGQQAK